MSSTVIAKNIQIGTSGTATNNFNWYQPASPDGTVRLGVGNYGATTLDAVTVNNSGNVGIGITPAAASRTTLQVGSLLTIDNQANVSNNAVFNSGWKYISTAAAAQYYVGAGAHYWYTAPSGTAGNAISFTQAMTLDASGRLLTPNQPAFRSNRTSSFTVTGGTSQEIVYNSAVFDINNNYNNSTGRFTAPVAGTYYFTATIQPTSSGANITLQFYVNGSAVAYTAVAWTPQPARGDLLISVVLRLNASDYVSAYTSASSTTTYDNNGSFSGFLVG